MLTLEQARAAILERIVATATSETVPLARARGRFAAAELRAQVDNPAFDNSSMDGYAVRAADLNGANVKLPLTGESRAGDTPKRLRSGSCMRIFTGAPIPEGCDAVAIQEDVQRDGDAIVFPRSIEPGENLRYRGEDFRRDELLYPVGRRLSAYDMALLGTAGVAQVPVFARARALVVATGDELAALGTPLKPGQIYESNRLATLAQLEDFGVEVVDGGTVGDDPKQLRALLRRSTDYDFIITSGGASVGDYDVVKQVFAEIGDIEFWKVRIKPGKPIAFGRVGSRTHFFALPGNPVSSLVTYKLFVEPALNVWHHGTQREWQVTATAINAFRRSPGRTEFLRARLYADGGRLMVEALKGQGSHMVGPMRATNAFIRLEADSTGFAAQESVAVMPLFL